MPRVAEDLAGRTFGQLRVLGRVHSRSAGVYWYCLCTCGKHHTVRGHHLTSHAVDSCGCARRVRISKAKTQHGEGRDRTAEYDAWTQMRDRCNRPTHHAFKHYGGRGIRVDPRWDSYDNFLEDMGRRPSAAHSLDRKDNSLGYSKENCRWATKVEQSNNTRTNRPVTCRGRTQSVTQWSRELGISKETLTSRLNRGESPEQALFGEHVPGRKAAK